MGRQLFYTIASSYITLYLAIVFLVVANTIVGVQFLMSQQKTGRRYQTLISGKFRSKITRSGRRAAKSRAASSNSVIASTRYPSWC